MTIPQKFFYLYSTSPKTTISQPNAMEGFKFQWNREKMEISLFLKLKMID